MRKCEFIEKYGEDAWKRNLKNQREWHKNHPKPKKEEYILKYGQEAWEKRLEVSRTWKRNHKEQHVDSVRKWQSDNMEKVRGYKSRWKINNPVEHRAQKLLDRYRQEDASCGRGECTLTKDFIINSIFAAKCIYCGDSDWKHLGADRIDNSKPHTEDNVVCSCGICNVERGNRHSVEEFIEYRKTHPRDDKPKKLQEIVEVNGVKVIRKVL